MVGKAALFRVSRRMGVRLRSAALGVAKRPLQMASALGMHPTSGGFSNRKQAMLPKALVRARTLPLVS